MSVNTDTMQFPWAKRHTAGAVVLSSTVGSRWRLIFRNVMRQRSRNFTQNLISLSKGDLYIASLVEPSAGKNIFERDYDCFSLPADLQADIAAMPAVLSSRAGPEFDAKLVTEEDSILFENDLGVIQNTPPYIKVRVE